MKKTLYISVYILLFYQIIFAQSDNNISKVYFLQPSVISILNLHFLLYTTTLIFLKRDYYIQAFTKWEILAQLKLLHLLGVKLNLFLRGIIQKVENLVYFNFIRCNKRYKLLFSLPQIFRSARFGINVKGAFSVRICILGLWEIKFGNRIHL